MGWYQEVKMRIRRGTWLTLIAAGERITGWYQVERCNNILAVYFFLRKENLSKSFYRFLYLKKMRAKSTV